MNDMRYDVVVVGAGQAGLAIGHFLAEQGRAVRDPRGGATRSARRGGTGGTRSCSSRRAATTRCRDSLSPATRTGTRRATRSSPTSSGTRSTSSCRSSSRRPVRSLTKDADGFVLDVDGRAIRADEVVVATGPFQAPNVPGFAGGLAADVFQTHSAGYRRPATCPRGACSSWAAATPASRSRRSSPAAARFTSRSARARRRLPQRLLGRDLFWWLTKLGLLSKTRRLAARPTRARPRHADRVEPARA